MVTWDFIGPPGSDATMMRLMPLRSVHHRCACLASRCIRVQPVASGASSAVPVSAARPGAAAARDAPGLRIIGHVTRLIWQPARSRCTSCIPRLETDAPAAASSPVSHTARRRAAMPRTWPARIAAAGRWRLLTWPCCATRETHTVITNPSSLQGSPLRLSYSAWFVIRSLPVRRATRRRCSRCP